VEKKFNQKVEFLINKHGIYNLPYSQISSFNFYDLGFGRSDYSQFDLGKKLKRSGIGKCFNESYKIDFKINLGCLDWFNFNRTCSFKVYDKDNFPAILFFKDVTCFDFVVKCHLFELHFNSQASKISS
jgi:hypothetical protein